MADLYQWHLNNTLYSGIDLNLTALGGEYTGQGVTIGIIDTGVQATHAELSASYNPSLQFDTITNTFAGAPTNTANAANAHGTAVAGLIGAANNNTGTTGVAYNADITSIRLFSDGAIQSQTDVTEAFQQARYVDIANNSWSGFYAPATTMTALADAVRYGRDGLGTLMVFSSGNYRGIEESWMHPLNSSRFSISVGAIDQTGRCTSFSTGGADLLLTAPGQDIMTTDITGNDGFSSINEHMVTGTTDYARIDGTSFSAPLVSGVIGLMLEANANLGYRDVQEILAYSSKQIDIGNIASWQFNHATNWNGGGLHTSRDYGYGLANAHDAVRLAETWQLIQTTPATMSNEISLSQTDNNTAMWNWFTNPDNESAPPENLDNFVFDNETFTQTFNMSSNIKIDHVEVQLFMFHEGFEDLTVELISPTGTVSKLVTPSTGLSSVPYQDNFVWKVNSSQFWGETGTGNWQLKVTDSAVGNIGFFTGWSLTFFGDILSNDDTRYFTNEYGRFTSAADSARRVWNDATGNDTLNAAAVTTNSIIDLIPGSSSSVIAGNTLTIGSTTLIENAIGGDGNDTIIGNSANNKLFGCRGNDALKGGDGIDSLAGGQGNDIYYVDSNSDVLTEKAFEGTDSVYSTVNFTLGANLENLSLFGNALNGTGNTLNNVLTGNGFNNIISGGTGIDTMKGLSGNDTYIVDLATDSIVENANEGTDTVQSTVSFTLGANLENLILMAANLRGAGNDAANILTGYAGVSDNILYGMAGNDTLYGSAPMGPLTPEGSGSSGNDYLDGGAGNDTMSGYTGNDTYVVDSSLDVIIENTAGGIDRVLSSLSFTLGANLENLILMAANLRGVGNDAANILTGYAGVSSNTLYGMGGNDTLYGSVPMGPLTPEGSGSSGNDYLDGGAGNDTMSGYTGNDTYVVDSSLDVIIENTAGGIDRVLSSLSFTLGANLENLILMAANLRGVGNNAANILTGYAGVSSNTLYGMGGNDTLYGSVPMGPLTPEGSGSSGNDYLDGGAGNDTMSGYTGNDTYVVDSSLDVIIENMAGGIDTVLSSISYILGSNLERLTLTGTSNLYGTGNTLNNVLTGNSGNNVLTDTTGNDVLNGGLGFDTMIGGIGNDIYSVDSTGDSIVENVDAGTDQVISSISFTLGANLENLTLTGSTAINGTGNSLTNMLFGNSGNNLLSDTLGGNNILYGGLGNDTLIGGTGIDNLHGDAGNDSLDAGLGNDNYHIAESWGADNISDGGGSDMLNCNLTSNLTINLIANTAVNMHEVVSGTNTVNWSVNCIENVASGSGNDSITGNSDANSIFANDGADTAIGGGGNDSLYGGNGNDVMWGATENDVLYGGNGNDYLSGDAGNDTLSGDYGNDTLLGSIGDDSYLGFSTLTGIDIINDLSGLDRAFFNGLNTTTAIWTAIDSTSDTDNFVDELLINFGSGFSVGILKYFSNTSIDDDLSTAGSGHIESLIFANDTSVTFADVKLLVA